MKRFFVVCALVLAGSVFSCSAFLRRQSVEVPVVSQYAGQRIGIVAGAGPLPGRAATFLRNAGATVFFICLVPEDNGNELMQHGKVIAQRSYKMGEVFKMLAGNNADRFLLIGDFDRNIIKRRVNFDFAILKLAFKILRAPDDQAEAAANDFFAKKGFRAVNRADLLLN